VSVTAKQTVMHISDCYLPRLGGIEVQVAELARIQATAGHMVHVVTATPAHTPDLEEGDAPRLHRIVAPLPFELPVHPRAGRALAHLLAVVAPDVVHVHVGAVSPFAWTAVSQAVRAGLPTVVSVHSMWDPLTSGIYRVLDVAKWRTWPIVTAAVSTAAARPLQDVLGIRAEVRVIPNGFDPVAFQPDPAARTALRTELHLSTDTPLIGMVARYDRQKDHQTFVAAAARLHARMPNVHFVLCGNGVDQSNAELVGWVTAAGLSHRCHILGERNDVARVTAALDLATLSSAYGEGFPNVLGEAMACEVPCVATDVGDSAHVVGDTGRIVPARDSDALAGAWGELLTAGNDELEALGQRARRRVLENFSISRVTHAYEAAYRSVVDSTVGSRQPIPDVP